MLKKLAILSSIFILTACQPHLDKMTLLREPSKAVVNNYSYDDYRNPDYLAFKSKMQLFASKLSESVIKREFKDNKNLALSPLSIELCLGLAVRGASNNTREELLKAFDIDYQTFNQFYKLFINQMSFEVTDEGKTLAQMLLTNSIWIDNDITLKDSGLDALKDDYYCYSYHVDFNGDNKNTNKAIQEFIKDKTKGLINPQLDLSPMTLFVLMNTLYMKDFWNDYGDDLPYADKENKFTNRDGKVSNKRLLNGEYFLGKTLTTDDYSCFHTETNRGFTLYFVKPNEDKDLKNIFNKDSINYVLDDSHFIIKDDIKRERYYTQTYFPEFKAECDIDLCNILKEDYNIKTLFNPATCDFTNLLDENQECFVSDIKHLAKLDVNKKGIEGAAVTLMAMCGAAAPDEDPYTDVYETFIVDKEFGYILTYNDAVVFSGTVTNID